VTGVDGEWSRRRLVSLLRGPRVTCVGGGARATRWTANTPNDSSRSIRAKLIGYSNGCNCALTVKPRILESHKARPVTELRMGLFLAFDPARVIVYTRCLI